MTRPVGFRSRRVRRLATASGAAILWSLAVNAHALPTGADVVAANGSGIGATFDTSVPGTLTVNQVDGRVVIDWATFNIGGTETVNFVQDGSNWIAFNRVDPSAFTTIDGSLNAQASIWIFSPGGLLIGNGANLDVGSLVLSTGQLLDSDIDDALGANTIPISPLAVRNGATLVISEGATIDSGGYIGVLGEQITQNGSLTAGGSIFFGVSEGGSLTFVSGPGGTQLTGMTVAGVAGRGQPSMTHGGGSVAGEGVMIAAQTEAQSAFSTVINLDGQIYAYGVMPDTDDGVVILTSGTAGQGDVQVDAAGAYILTSSGDISVSASSVILGEVNAGQYDVTVLAENDITTTGDITGHQIDIYAYGEGAVVTIEQMIDAYYDIDITSLNGDVVVASTASIYAGYVEGYSVDIQAEDLVDIEARSIISGDDIRIRVTDGGGTLNSYGDVYGDDIYFLSDGAANIGGVVGAYGYLSIVGVADVGNTGAITISGDLTGGDGVFISNSHGDVVLTSTASVHAVDPFGYFGPGGRQEPGGGETALYGQDGDIYIYSSDRVVTQFGSVLYSDPSGYGEDAGLITIVAAGTGTLPDDAAIDLGGDIDGSTVDIDALNGGIRLRTGAIAGDQITIDAAQDLFQDSTHGIVGGTIDVTTGDDLYTAGGISGPSVTLTSTGAAGDPDGGDIHLFGGAIIIGATIDIVADGALGDIEIDAGVVVDAGSTVDGPALDIRADGDVTIDSGAYIEASGDISIQSLRDGGHLNSFGYVESLSGDVYFFAYGDIHVGGEVTASYGFIDVRAAGGDSAAGDVTVSGDLEAAYGISITNYNDGDVILTSTATLTTYYDQESCGPACLSGGGNQLQGNDGDIYIYSAGSVITAAGSVIDATLGAGVDQGLVTIVAAGADETGNAAMDLSGDIIAFDVDLTTTQGSIRIRDGNVSFSDSFDANSGLHFITDGPSQIQGDPFAPANISATGDMSFGGAFHGYTIYIESTGAGVTGGSTIEISGTIYASDIIGIRNLDGDIHLTATGELYAGVPVEFGDPSIYLEANGTISSEAGSHIHTHPDYVNGEVDITTTAASGLGMNLAGDISSGDVSLTAYNADIYITGGTITAYDEIDIAGGFGRIMIQDGEMIADGLVHVRGHGAILLGGDITADSLLAQLYDGEAGVDPADLSIDGVIETQNSILATNDTGGDVILAANGSLHANLDGTPQSPGSYDVDLYSEYGQIVTQAGSSITVGPSGPATPQGSVRLHGATDSSPLSALDLSGDIDTQYLQLEAGVGGIIFRNGTTNAVDAIYAYADGAVVVEGPALLTSAGAVSLIGDDGVTMNGSIVAGGDVLLDTPSEHAVVIGGDIAAEGSIVVYSEDGDILVNTNADLIADTDNTPSGEGGEFISLFASNGSVVTQTGTSMRVGSPAGDPTGNVYIYGGIADLGAFGVDLAGDIAAHDLIVTAPNSSIRIRDGNIDLEASLEILSVGSLIIDGPASITTEGDVSLTAHDTLTMVGSIDSGGDVSLLKEGTDGDAITVGGSIDAADGVSIVNEGGSITLAASQISADTDDDGGSDIVIDAAGQVVATGAAQLLVGDVNAPTGDVFITAGGGDGGGFSAIDLTANITAQGLTLDADNGSIHQASGVIDLTNALVVSSAFDFVQDSPAVIQTDGSIGVTAAGALIVNGQMIAGNDIDLLRQGSAVEDLLVGGFLQADGSIAIVNDGPGDVVLDSVDIIADQDSGGGASIVISSDGLVTTIGEGLVSVGGDGVGTGDVGIFAYGSDVPHHAIEWGFDITAQDLVLRADDGSIHLTGGTFELSGALDAEAYGAFMLDETAVISSDGGVTATASQGILVAGVIDSGGDVSLTVTGLVGALDIHGDDLAVTGQLVANGGIALINEGPGDVVIDGAMLVADLASVGAGDIYISSDGQVLADASSLQVGGQGPTGDITIIAHGGDGGGYSAIDLNADINAGGLILDADNGSINLAGGEISLVQDLSVTSGFDIVFDEPVDLDVGGDISLTADHNLLINGDLDAGGDISLLLTAESDQDLTVGANLFAGQSVSIVNQGSGDVVLAGGTIASHGYGEGGGGIYVSSEGQVIADGGALTVGTEAYGPTGDVVIVAGGADGGGYSAIDLNIDIFAQGLHLDADNGSINLAGGDIQLTEDLLVVSGFDFVMDEPASINGGGAVDITAANLLVVNGDITAADDIRLLRSGASSADLTVGGTLVADGDVTIFNQGSGDVVIGSTASVTADANGDSGAYTDLLIYSDGRVVTEAGSSLHVGSGSTRTGFISIYAYGYDGEGGAAVELSGDMDAASVSVEAYNGSVHVLDGSIQADNDIELVAWMDFVLDASASVWGGQNSSNALPGDVWPVLPTGPASVTIVASDVDIQGSVTGGAGQNPGSIVIVANELAGDVTVGGADGGLGGNFQLSNDEFQNLDAGTIIIAAGGDGEVAPGFDMTIEDLQIDGDVVNQVWFGTSQQMFIPGAITSTGAEGADLHFGFVVSADIDTGDFAATTLVTVDLIPEAIYLSGSIGTPEQPFGLISMISHGDVLIGTEAFIQAAANDPEFDALEESENFDPPSEDHVFVAADQLQIASTGRVLQQDTDTGLGFAGLVIGVPEEGSYLITSPEGLSEFGLDFSSGPTRVELFGVMIDGSGQVTGLDVAHVDGLLDPDIELGEYEINSCLFGSSECRSGFEPPIFHSPFPPIDPDVLADAPIEALIQGLVFSEPEDEEEDDDPLADPVTGTGNEDLWTSSEGVRP